MVRFLLVRPLVVPALVALFLLVPYFLFVERVAFAGDLYVGP